MYTKGRPIDPTATYGIRETASLVFGTSSEWFYKNRYMLEDEHGFPRPVKTVGHARYSGHQLLAWIEKQETANAEILANRPRPRRPRKK
jgi:hypothetical protein